MSSSLLEELLDNTKVASSNAGIMSTEFILENRLAGFVISGKENFGKCEDFVASLEYGEEKK